MSQGAAGETVEPPAFSNGTEYDIWRTNYCDRCWYDRVINRHNWKSKTDPDWSKGCEWHALMLAHEPVEVLVYRNEELPPFNVHCLKFTPDDGGPDEGLPKPPPQVPGQLSMDDLVRERVLARTPKEGRET